MEQQLAYRSPLSVKLIVGLFFATIGILLTLDNFDLVDSYRYLRYWPAVLIVVGLLKLSDPLGRAAGIVAIVAGSLLLALTAGFRIGLHDFWALGLIGVGALLVLQSLGLRPRRWGDDRTIWGVLSNQETVITATDFSRLSAVTFMGSAKIDLTGADMTTSPAVIDVFALMGAIEIYVPNDWEVMSEAVPFMGGIDMNTRSRGTGKRLVVQGFVMMGGIDIKSFPATSASERTV